MSDNGPWLSYGDHGGSTGPLREGKGTTFEGGVRVPCIMRWVVKIPPGSICREPMMTIDLFPTIAKFIGAELPQNKIDGRDASDLVLATPNAKSPQQAYYFYYHRNDLQAIRSGRWKLHFPHKYRSMDGRELGSGGTPGKYDNNRKTGLELYDLIADIGELRNVADAHPEVVKKLTELADVMRHDLGDNLSNIIFLLVSINSKKSLWGFMLCSALLWFGLVWSGLRGCNFTGEMRFRFTISFVSISWNSL